MLPGINYGQIFNLSFGNTTFVFLLFTFLMTYALEQTPALRRFVARALGSSFAGKSPWHFIGAFLRQRSCHFSPLYFADDSLYDRLPDLRGNHGRSRVEKRGQRGFGAPDLHFLPRWQSVLR